MLKPLTIGKLAKASGVGVETIRFYEKKGLIQRPTYSSACAYRQYDPVNVNRLTFVLRAKILGFSLKEIKELLNLRASSKSNCGSVKSKAEKKLEEVSNKIEDLMAIKAALEKLILSCSVGIPSPSCPILEALDSEKS